MYVQSKASNDLRLPRGMTMATYRVLADFEVVAGDEDEAMEIVESLVKDGTDEVKTVDILSAHEVERE